MAVNEFVEFTKQYDKTFIRVKFEGSKAHQVVVIKGCVSDDENNPYIIVQNPVIGQCTVNWKESKQNIDYTFPKVGLFNHDSGFFMFHRFPDRQWKRGISSGNSHVSDPLFTVKNHLGRLGLAPYISSRVEFQTLSSAFSGFYPKSIDEAIELLLAPRQLGVALDGMFGITKSPTDSPVWLLWKHLSVIGYIHPKEHQLEVVESTFQQEVSDFLKRQQEHTWILK